MQFTFLFAIILAITTALAAPIVQLADMKATTLTLEPRSVAGTAGAAIAGELGKRDNAPCPFHEASESSDASEKSDYSAPSEESDYQDPSAASSKSTYKASSKASKASRPSK